METKTTPKKVSTKKAATPVSLEATIFNQKGTKAGSITLPEKVFGLSWNADLVHQVITSMMSNKRAGTAHTKDRSEVSGGGKKPYAQKGTGQARHGSSRSPIWTGGGITFGPRNDKDYSKKINKKMRVKALYTILSRRFGEGKVLFIDSLSLSAIKTKDASALVAQLATVEGFAKMTHSKRTATLVTLAAHDEVLEKSFANLPGVTVIAVAELNPIMALEYNHLVMVDPSATVATLEAKMK